jgi:hypothetical protein
LNSSEVKKYYHAWVVPYLSKTGKINYSDQQKKTIHGILFDVRDSSLLITNTVQKKNLYRGSYSIMEFDAGDIGKLILQRNGTRYTGVAIGLTGLAVGLTIGTIVANHQGEAHGTGESLSRGLTVMSITLVGTGVGILIGIIVDHNAKKRIPIEGSREPFERNKERLKTYSLKYSYKDMDEHPATFSILQDTVRDIDGNIYPAVALGRQVWMAENLRVRHFRNGSEINGHVTTSTNKEQKYDWYSVHDDRALCPAGWHIPTKEEWNSLINSLGNFEQGWKMEHGFAQAGAVSHWWSSTEQDSLKAWSVYLDNKTTGIMITTSEKASLLTVRCIRDY